MGEIGPDAKAALPELAKFFKHPSADIRKDAIDAVSVMGPAAAGLSTALGEILSNDKNDHIRLAAAYALNEIGAGARPAVITIVEALKSDTYIGVREECAHALGSIGFAGPTVLNALKEATKSDDLGISQAAKMALDSLPKPDND